MSQARTKNAVEISHGERDLQLGLEHPNWPEEGCPLGDPTEQPPTGAQRWERRPGYLTRQRTDRDDRLWEALLRFPNAPVYGLHKRPARQPAIEGRSNFHTFRVIGRTRDRDEQGQQRAQIGDVYILHNGLNETSDFDLHYRLASQLLENSERPAVCIIRPFPSHLTRYPYSDMFAEKPLDTFLLDSGDLFRQFMRFMLETRWLLSILVPRPSYSVITGGKLVDCEDRSDSRKLAQAIFDEWNLMDEASPEDRRRARKEGEGRQDVTVTAIKTTIELLRKQLLLWSSGTTGERIPASTHPEPPAVHMIGYSLGSFLAQSAFFAWPYAISGNVTLFGGGELRKLSPTAFAQPEEWQSVLHSLRYELDRAMTGDGIGAQDETIVKKKGPRVPVGKIGPLVPVKGRVQGIDVETFEYLRRVFYEVFLQYYQGSYRTRLAEFIQRMLFVTGGQDPIVRPGNVLDAAPSEGVNLINIAGMSHFPTKPRKQLQKEQRDHWLGQLGRIIPAFAKEADERRLDVLRRSWLDDKRESLHPDALEAYTEYKRQLDEVGEPPWSGPSGSGPPLSDRWFGKEIDRITETIAGGAGGWVLVSRNEIPPVFQTEKVMKRYAAALHHSEDLAADEFWLASQRRETLLNNRDRVTLMITDIAREIGFEEVPSVFPARSETPGVAHLSQAQLDDVEDYFRRNWEDAEPGVVRVLSSGEFRPDQLGELGKVVADLQGLDPEDPETEISVRFLPDVWIGLDERLITDLLEGIEVEEGSGRAVTEAAIAAWGTGLAEERAPRKTVLREALEKAGAAAGLEKSLPCETLLQSSLKSGRLSIVEFSRAGLNPRYRGQRITRSRRAGQLLIHWALAYEAAGVEPEEKPAAV